jgi:hypothetical protein
MMLQPGLRLGKDLREVDQGGKEPTDVGWKFRVGPTNQALVGVE